MNSIDKIQQLETDLHRSQELAAQLYKTAKAAKEIAASQSYQLAKMYAKVAGMRIDCNLVGNHNAIKHFLDGSGIDRYDSIEVDQYYRSNPLSLAGQLNKYIDRRDDYDFYLFVCSQTGTEVFVFVEDAPEREYESYNYMDEIHRP